MKILVSGLAALSALALIAPTEAALVNVQFSGICQYSAHEFGSYSGYFAYDTDTLGVDGPGADSRSYSGAIKSFHIADECSGERNQITFGDIIVSRLPTLYDIGFLVKVSDAEGFYLNAEYPLSNLPYPLDALSLDLPAAVPFNTGVLFSGETYAYYNSSIHSVPEPAAWVMMIIGFGLIGAVARRRRVELAA